MPDQEEELRSDLVAIAAWLDSVYPEHAPVTLISALQSDASGPREVGILFADFSGVVQYSGPVVRDARWALSIAGWTLQWNSNAKTLAVIVANSQSASAHDIISALGRFGGG
ncbi:hypothetical protein DLJ49_19955 [Rhodovulum sp. 12E13]|uniref:hypothetical protein n=1 Tax=Rhodovulum sp. 12E13 TaxID=2203891 RepID=UPI000E11D6EA|nr:hypothetical protein [Rhodovulum sp. 12E13]RDC68485.1 hypothetical protein DLJ49_19955 [Rhodovulum sp. 12E13]